jgi:hypothetical protein
MVGTIGYLGKVHLRLGLICALLYSLGAALTAGAIGVALGAVGMGIRALLGRLGGEWDLALPAGGAAFLVVCAVYELAAPRLRIPQRRWQLERSHWVLLGRRQASFRWGAVMGLIIWTPIVFPALFAVPVLALVSASPWSGGIIMGAYGLALGLWLIPVILALRWVGDGVNTLIQTPLTLRWSHCINGATALALGAYLSMGVAASVRGF